MQHHPVGTELIVGGSRPYDQPTLRWRVLDDGQYFFRLDQALPGRKIVEVRIIDAERRACMLNNGLE